MIESNDSYLIKVKKQQVTRNYALCLFVYYLVILKFMISDVTLV